MLCQDRITGCGRKLQAPMSLGQRFRAAREERGLTLSEVSEQLRIRSVYLAAIEDEDWKAIGAAVYTRGFLRTYARFLGLDPEEAVGEFNGRIGAVSAASESPARTAVPEYREPRSLSPLIWLAGAVALLLIAFVVYLYFAPPRNAGGTVAAVATPASSPSGSFGTAAAAAAPATPSPLPRANTLAIRISAPSWLRVTVDGDVRMEGTFPAGTSRTFHGKTALVRVGNAGGVDLILDGKPLGKLGGPGDVVEKSFTL